MGSLAQAVGVSLAETTVLDVRLATIDSNLYQAALSATAGSAAALASRADQASAGRARASWAMSRGSGRPGKPRPVPGPQTVQRAELFAAARAVAAATGRLHRFPVRGLRGGGGV